ncbi:MAG: helix-turn-helix domain-containing protein [Ruminococcaceae bacterium]|nr:helix-turn-helix domain-containing protein [Oscillospiraceae bacterium]
MFLSTLKTGEIMKLEDLKKLASGVPVQIAQENYAQLQQAIVQLGLDPNNLYQELEMSARFAQAHRDVSYSNTILQLHSHTFYEILCCRNSCGAEYLVGTERYRLQKGDIVFVAPGVGHRPLLPEELIEPYERDVLWISEELVALLRQNFGQEQVPEGSGLLRTAGTKWAYLGDLLHEAVRTSEQHPGDWEMAVMGAAVSFLTHLRRAFLARDTVPVPAEKPDLLERAMAYIERNLAEKITLSQIAQHFYVSESTISQTFRKKVGVSFYRVVTQRRLIAAKQLILEEHALESVAEQCGFMDYSAFYRAFKQEFGISPRQYRNLVSTGK